MNYLPRLAKCEGISGDCTIRPVGIKRVLHATRGIGWATKIDKRNSCPTRAPRESLAPRFKTRSAIWVWQEEGGPPERTSFHRRATRHRKPQSPIAHRSAVYGSR